MFTVPPKITELSVQDAIVGSNTSVTHRCCSAAFPYPKISWSVSVDGTETTPPAQDITSTQKPQPAGTGLQTTCSYLTFPRTDVAVYTRSLYSIKCKAESNSDVLRRKCSPPTHMQTQCLKIAGNSDSKTATMVVRGLFLAFDFVQ